MANQADGRTMQSEYAVVVDAGAEVEEVVRVPLE
jgi:hypothetical protein